MIALDVGDLDYAMHNIAAHMGVRVSGCLYLHFTI